MSLSLYISPGAHLHIIYLLPALLVKQGLTFFWICWRECLTLRECCSISMPAKQREERFKNLECYERTHSWLVISGAQSTHPSSATHSTCVTVSFFCVPTCQERRLNKRVNKRSPNSGRQSFCVPSTYCWEQIWRPKRLMPAPCSLRQSGLLEPDHSEKQTNKQLSWNNPDWWLSLHAVCAQLSDCVWPHCSPPGSSVHRISQARILEWVAMPFSRGSSQPRDRNHVSCLASGFFTFEPLGKPLVNLTLSLFKVVSNNPSL